MISHLKVVLISGGTEFSTYEMPGLCKTSEDESTGAKGVHSGASVIDETFESGIRKTAKKVGRLIRMLVGGKYQIPEPGGLLKGLSWFHTTDSCISRSFLFFPALSFIFILMQTEGALTSTSPELSYSQNWALQERDTLGLLCSHR